MYILEHESGGYFGYVEKNGIMYEDVVDTNPQLFDTLQDVLDVKNHPHYISGFGKLKLVELIKKTIVTKYIHKPIPVRQYDWEAHYDDYDEGDHIGYGATEQQAIDDLKQQAQ